MTLGALIAAAHALSPDARARVEESRRQDHEVTGITHDSRGVAPGVVFVAVRGQRSDGATFAGEAQRRGAVAIVAETSAPAGITIPWIRTPDARSQTQPRTSVSQERYSNAPPWGPFASSVASHS